MISHLAHASLRVCYALSAIAALAALAGYLYLGTTTLNSPQGAASVTHVTFDFPPGRPANSTMCGLYAIATVCTLHGTEVNLQDLFDDLSWATGASGLTMLELQRCLHESFGFHVRGFELSASELAQETCPAILWLKGGRASLYRNDHYVVFVGITGESGNFVIVDPMRGVTVLTPDQLEALWTGPCLLVSRSD